MTESSTAAADLPSCSLLQAMHDESTRADLLCAQEPPVMAQPITKKDPITGKSWTADSEQRYASIKKHRPSLVVFSLREADSKYPMEFATDLHHHYAYDLHKALLAAEV